MIRRFGQSRLLAGGLLLALFVQSIPAVELGSLSFETFDADNVDNPNRMTLPPPGGDFTADLSASLRGVGGVNFQQVASPASGWKIESMKFLYDSSRYDGDRLRVVAGPDTLSVGLPDWQWVPMAKYANTDNYACFTLFGKLKDKQLEKQVLDQNKQVLNYHQKLENTLLGLRLFQMDILILQPSATDLPKEGGRYLLGEGENVPTPTNGTRALMEFRSQLAAWSNVQGNSFQSYMISDFANTPIRFRKENSRLAIDGTPYFFAWTMKKRLESYSRQAVYDREFDRICDDTSWCTKVGTRSYQFSGRDKSSRRLLAELEGLSKRMADEKLPFEQPQIQEILDAPDSAKLSLVGKFSPLSLMQFVAEANEQIEGSKPVHLKILSDSVSSHPEMLRAINPAVWDATTNTMRYSAFFRYCRSKHPGAWKDLMAKAEKISISPAVRTPTVLGNK